MGLQRESPGKGIEVVRLIDGVSLTSLKIIVAEGGNVLHAMKASDGSFSGFGEAYFSTITEGRVKGWKCHRQMILNLIVVVGSIRFVLYDGRDKSSTFQTLNEFILGPAGDYSRLTIAPEIWMAFQGIGAGDNILLNIADIEHDPNEVDRLPLANDVIPHLGW